MEQEDMNNEPGLGTLSGEPGDMAFTSVSIDEFFDTKDEAEESIETGIVILTPYQSGLVKRLLDALHKHAPDRCEKLEQRLRDVRRLAKALAAFPSLLERSNLTSSVRTQEGLVDSLISYPEDGDTLLHLPSKASLGKSFLVTKTHTFYSMSKLAKNYAMMSDREVQEYTDETTAMMFTLMAEDVYMNLIRDKSLPEGLRRQLAFSLLILWEHRSDQTISDIAPTLRSIWLARRSLAPAFGTMMGTSELLLLSIQLDDQWAAFIKAKLGDDDVTQAMEEFLFGLSHEQILKLRSILREKGVKAIGRDEVSTYLGERVKTDISPDYRDFYLLYTVRRDNARARQRMHLPGPKKTIEDHFFLFVIQSEFEKQENDRFAKEQD